MFKKLVSNLPFNPSLLGTVAFYGKRLRAEESIRRLGFGFVALAMFIQMFAVMAPPEKSLAYSNDYIINGLRTREDILRAWDGKTGDQNVAAIYSRFGLTRDDIAALPLYPNATIRSDSADYWTIGRTSLSAVSKASKIKSQYKTNEVPVTAGPATVYLRQLRAWDIVNSYNTYRAFEGTKNGKKFWILVDCGNFTQADKPLQPTPTPTPTSTPTPTPLATPQVELRKSIDGGPRTLKPGERFSFRFEYRNAVPDSYLAENVKIEDDLDLNSYTIVQPDISPYLSGNHLSFPIGTVQYTPHFNVALVLEVQLKQGLNNGTSTCNIAKLTSSNAGESTSGGSGLCINVIDLCPLDASLPANDPRCSNPELVCSLTNSDVNRTTKQFTLKTVVTSSNPQLTSIQSYVYDFGDGSSVISRASSDYTDTVTHTYRDGSYTATVIVNYKAGNGSAATDRSVACSGIIDSQPDQPLSQSKMAKNLTQNIEGPDITSSKAKAGDVVEYYLITHNSYDYKRTNVNLNDYIGDILDYADLDEAFLAQQGGTFDPTAKTIAWTNQSVEASSSLTNTFRVKLKNPLPSTNQPGTMTTAYDCKISNKFGNQLDITVDCPLPKSAEYISEKLPKTGPGESLAIGFIGTAVIAYFFARSRLLAEEVELIRTDFAMTGGV